MRATSTGKGYIQYREKDMKDRKSVASRKGNRVQKRRCSGVSGVVAIVTALVIISGFLMADSFPSLAQSEVSQGKFYKSVTIKKNDTLWNIAEEYITDDYESVEEYVAVLKEMNNLHGDKILSGDKLIVAYNAAF